MNIISKDLKVEQFEELLTPYVQGRLDEETQRKVVQFAESSAEFAEMLRFEQQIAASVNTASADSVAVMPSFQKLKRKIDSQEQPENGLRTFFASLGNLVGGYSPALVAASLVVFALALLTLQRPAVETLDNGFETLTDPSLTVPSIEMVAGREYLKVVPVEDTETNGIRQLADEFGFIIENGPSGIGSYVVSIESNSEDAGAIAKSWRRDTRFLFVGPAAAVETSE